MSEGSVVGEVVIVVGVVLAVLWGLRRWARRRRSGKLHVSQDTIARLRRTRDEGGQG